MAGPEEKTCLRRASAIQSVGEEAKDTTARDGTTRVVQCTPSSDTIDAPTELSLESPIVAMQSEATIINSTCKSTPVLGDETTAAVPASGENAVLSTGTISNNTTLPFLKLSGELRNRIYRLYFEDFQEQMSRRFPYSKTKMSPNFLALMHTNRMIRSEAGSIFYKEVAPFHSFTCPTDQAIEAVMLTRIRDVCSLVSIRDVHTRISIRCKPSWKDRGDVNNRNEDRWRRREITTFAIRALLHNAHASQPPDSRDATLQWMKSVCSLWSSCASDHTTEARTRTGFLVKYRCDGTREDENFVHIEGPLAEVRWNEISYI